MNNCIYCNKLISKLAIRCKSCSRKGNRNGRFKNGWPVCIDCGNKLSRYGTFRCRNCVSIFRIGQRRPEHSKIMKGHKASKETRIKMSISRKRYCKKHAKDFIGKNNPAWIDGRSYDNYPKGFSCLRTIIRKRDRYKCQNCKITEKQHLIKAKQNLEIHHIDYNKQNCKLSNLITLCKQCNLKANKNRDYWFAYYAYIIKIRRLL